MLALYFGEARVGERGGWRVVSDGSSPQALNEWRRCIIQRASPADSTMIYAPRQRKRGARERKAAEEGTECERMNEREGERKKELRKAKKKEKTEING